MELVISFITALNSMTPLAVVALSLFIVYHVVAKKGRIRKLTDNHLAHIGEDVNEMKTILGEVRDGIKILIDRSR